MTPRSSSLWRSLRVYQIYGANTNVGKTIMSTILCKAFARKFPAETTWYLKPVSTGPLDEADDRHLTRFSPETKTSCLFQFDEAVSPHIAARSSKVCASELVMKLNKLKLIIRTASFRHRSPRTGSRSSVIMCSIRSGNDTRRNSRRSPLSNTKWKLSSRSIQTIEATSLSSSRPPPRRHLSIDLSV